MTMPNGHTQDGAPQACPKCDTVPTKVGSFWICPQHGQLPEARQFTAQRIFLSYGHDANEPLVRHIKSDLEHRGHDVWFDKSEIKSGDDWRREITDGIAASQKVVSFLSKHSTRDPGVCLDEVGIAIGVKGGNIQTILVESEAEVNPPPTVGHIQWLDMHDWAAKCEKNRDDWGNWYQEKLAEIIRVIESDESQRFAGEIETLSYYLKPISSDSRIATLLRKGFVGRQWLFDAVESWRSSSGKPSRLFWITGDPGVGKSAFAAQLTHFGQDKVVAAQFVEWDKPDHRNAGRVIRSLAFQLACRFPDYRKLLLTLPEIRELDQKREAELFDYLLANPLKTAIEGGRERYLIVIDALDEAADAGFNPLVDMLAKHSRRLPEWLGLVVTSRHESAVTTPLQGLNPSILNTDSEANLADIRDYLRQHLSKPLEDLADVEGMITQIIEKSAGLFLYIECFCSDVQDGYLSLEDPDQFPHGLGGIYFQWLQRQFPDLDKFRNDVRPALRAILAAREPLPVRILQRLFHWHDEDRSEFTRSLGSLFPVTNEADGPTIKPYHKSLADWVADEAASGPYFVSETEGHRLLANAGWQDFEHSINTMDKYHVRCLPSHLHQLERYEDLYSLLHNGMFITRLRSFESSDPIDCLPEHVRSWAYGAKGVVRVTGTAANGVLQPPGSWFTVLEHFHGGIDWQCRRCLDGNNGLITNRPGSHACPDCGYEGNKNDREAWLAAKDRFNEPD